MLSCFFPAHNEESDIGPLLEEALEDLPSFAEAFEVIVVDDGSTDRTAEVVRGFERDHPEVRLVSHARNLGYGQALRTGLREAKGDAVFFTDADRQFRIADLRLLLQRSEEADIVAGYRIRRRDPWHRLLIARIYHLALRAMFGLGLHDVDCAFKLVHRRVLDAVGADLVSRSAFISPELLIRAQRAGYRIVETGIPHHPRRAGRSEGATPRVIARTLREMWRMRRVLGPRA